MFLHTSTSTVARYLYAAPSRATLISSLHFRYSKNGRTHRQLQDKKGITLQQSRHHCWKRPLTGYEESNTLCRVVNISTAPYSTARTSTEKTEPVSQDILSVESSSRKDDDVDIEALVELEVELYRQEGSSVPSQFNAAQWQELITLPSVSSRKKYLTFLFKNEMKRINQKRIKELKREQREEQLKQLRENPPEGNGHIEYGLWKNSIFLKILETTMNQFYHSKVAQAMLYGQPMVVDLDFEEHMSRMERQNCAYQLQMMISVNRRHDDPYNLEFHNARPTLDTMARLHRYVPTLYKEEYPLPIYSGSYLEKYPREQLVYLTPHCKEELLTYDHNAVYIIGGLVDKSSGEPLSLAKAKREGIRMQKLPLERYLSWGVGNKCLTLNQILNILLDFKTTGNWPHALSHVPRRKLQPLPQSQEAKEEKVLKRIQLMERRFKKY